MLKHNYTVQWFSDSSELATTVNETVSWFIHRRFRSREEIPKRLVNANVQVLRLLISSPGDVIAERDRFAKAVFRFNQQEIEQSGLFIKLIRWEDMAPQIGPRAQDVINKQIGRYNIFAGIMWNRFGTPNDIASSGTEEEFQIAINSWQQSKKPWIVFYFCDRPASFTNEQQIEQKRLVLKLRSELEGMGVIRTYKNIDEFENLVFQDLLCITSQPEFRDYLS